MAKIPTELLVSLIQLGIEAFSKKRKVRKVLELVGDNIARAASFKDARMKIDTAEQLGAGVTLTVAETEALDFVMDEFSAVARKVKKHL